MKNINYRILAIVSSIAILINLIAPISVHANSENTTFKETYELELQQMGITKEKINSIQNITNKIAQAESGFEVSQLMEEYHKLVDNTPLMGSSSFYTSSGGTLELDYKGKVNPISDVIFTKVIYLPEAQTTFYQNAINKEGFIDWVENRGIDVVTTLAASKIAKYLGVKNAIVSWLIGLPISITFSIIRNAEKWDLSDAIDRSNTGKVKLEYFYSISASYPYYMNHKNFEPWNSSRVEIPSNYDYKWSKDEYDF